MKLENRKYDGEKMKSTTDLTDNERAAILARTNEVSIKQTAEEFEISPDDVINLIYGPALPPAPTSVPDLNSNDSGSKLHSDSDRGDNDGDNNRTKPLPLSSTFLIRSSKSFSARNFTPIFFRLFINR